MTLFSLFSYSIISCLLLLGLIGIDGYVHGRVQIALRLAIHIVSVALFFVFLWFLMTYLIRPGEMTQSLAAAIFIFVLVGSGLFYYIGRKNI